MNTLEVETATRRLKLLRAVRTLSKRLHNEAAQLRLEGQTGAATNLAVNAANLGACADWIGFLLPQDIADQKPSLQKLLS